MMILLLMTKEQPSLLLPATSDFQDCSTLNKKQQCTTSDASRIPYTLTARCQPRPSSLDVISGLPANTSRERLDLLDDGRRVTGFSITGGEHRLRNYKSVTTVHGFERDGRVWSVVLESYVVDVPEGNTEEDTRLFADTVVKLNLQKLASVAEGMDGNSGDGRNSPVM